jgi:hypothetical protein
MVVAAVWVCRQQGIAFLLRPVAEEAEWVCRQQKGVHLLRRVAAEAG